MRAALRATELVNYYSWDGNLEKAHKQVAFACAALRAKGIEPAVDLYAGSLKKAIQSHIINGDVHLIVTRVGMVRRIVGFLNGSSLKRPALSPVLLIHPGMAA